MPTKKTTAVTVDDIERARQGIVHAAIEFDAIEEGEPEADWRTAVDFLYVAAEALGCEDVMESLGIA